jgi:hypothetical protein
MSSFKKPDVKAPRFRPKVHKIDEDAFYKEFIKKHPKYSQKKIKELKKILRQCNEELWKAAIDNRDGIDLPQSMGNIFIGACRNTKSKRNIDFNRSMQEQATVYNRNMNEDGLLCKIFYSNKHVKYKVADRQIWQFIACRKFKRATSKAFAENWYNYYKMDSTVKIAKMYEDVRKKNKSILFTNRALPTYNEFDI